MPSRPIHPKSSLYQMSKYEKVKVYNKWKLEIFYFSWANEIWKSESVQQVNVKVKVGNYAETEIESELAQTVGQPQWLQVNKSASTCNFWFLRLVSAFIQDFCFALFIAHIEAVTLASGQGIYWSRYVFKCIQILQPNGRIQHISVI